MTRQRQFLFIGIAALVFSIAFALRNLIYEIVIIPLAYLWWWLGLYYRLVPQIILWILLIFAILFIAIRGLLQEIPLHKEVRVSRKKNQGPIESLSEFEHKRGRGIYYKWLIANRLGRVARDLLDQREGRREAKRFTRLNGRDWNPPKDVSEYLESGLNGSFADFPQVGWVRQRPTPLDLDPQNVIEYLESEMEINRNGNR